MMPGASNPPQKCKACSAPIFFVKTAATGKFMPLDARPERRIWLDKAGKAHSVSVYVPHHVSCPKADQFRKERQHGGQSQTQ